MLRRWARQCAYIVVVQAIKHVPEGTSGRLIERWRSEAVRNLSFYAIKANFDWPVQSWTGPASSVTLLRDGRYTSFKDRLVPGTDATGSGNHPEGCGAFFSTNSRT